MRPQNERLTDPKNKKNYMRDYMKDYQKQKIICECGQEISRSRYYKHKQTNIHLKYLDIKEENNIPDNTRIILIKV